MIGMTAQFVNFFCVFYVLGKINVGNNQTPNVAGDVIRMQHKYYMMNYQ